MDRLEEKISPACQTYSVGICFEEQRRFLEVLLGGSEVGHGWGVQYGRWWLRVVCGCGDKLNQCMQRCDSMRLRYAPLCCGVQLWYLLAMELPNSVLSILNCDCSKCDVFHFFRDARDDKLCKQTSQGTQRKGKAGDEQRTTMVCGRLQTLYLISSWYHVKKLDSGALRWDWNSSDSSAIYMPFTDTWLQTKRMDSMMENTTKTLTSNLIYKLSFETTVEVVQYPYLQYSLSSFHNPNIQVSLRKEKKVIKQEKYPKLKTKKLYMYIVVQERKSPYP